MGTWGTKLYQDDVTEDVRYAYTELLRKGKTGEEATQELIDTFRDELADTDDAPLFWFALADTQWNIGRLQDTVKENALKFIDDGEDLKRWATASPSQYSQRKAVLAELKDKLSSPQPPEKKISKRRTYRCQWNLGDVYAYRLSGNYAEQKQLKGKYLYFVKVGEDDWTNDSIIPVVYVYWTMSDEILPLEKLEQAGFIPQFFVPSVYEKDKTLPIKYRLSLLSTSSRIIPKNNLTYIGNTGSKEPLEQPSIYSTFKAWKDFEEYIINDFNNWEGYRYLTKR